MSNFSQQDHVHMAQALKLAQRGRYSARPNPLVGCVIVADDQPVGQGWHVRAGEPHAEVNALAMAGSQARGATVYVTLEPCAHHGRTPPCCEALIAAGVGRVVMAMQDPFDQVAGRGLAALAAAGIPVQQGLMEDAARSLNSGYLMRLKHGRPRVTLKVAASLDGATAMASGESQWITGVEARRDVQRLRARAAAVMTGVGTVLADDPALNVRDASLGADQPLRVVVDSHARLPIDASMLSLDGETRIYCAADAAPPPDVAGSRWIPVPLKGEHVDLQAVLQDLGDAQINDLLVECGPTLAGALIDQALVDELVIYQSPHIMGSEVRSMFRTPGWKTLSQRQALEITDVRRLGADTRITARMVD